MAEKQLRFFGADEGEKKPISKPVGRKDIFLMSFLAFITAGLFLGGIAFAAGTITTNAVLDLSGEKEVVEPEVEDPPVEEEIVEEIVEEVVEETTTEEEPQEETVEEVVEEVIEDVDDSNCGEVTLTKGEPITVVGKEVEMTLGAGFSAQISVDGDARLMTVGDSELFGSLRIQLKDTNDSSSTVFITC